MKYTQLFKDVVKSGDLERIDQMLFEMPRTLDAAKTYIPFQSLAQPDVPPTGESDLVANMRFIANIIKNVDEEGQPTNYPNRMKVIRRLLMNITILEDDFTRNMAYGSLAAHLIGPPMGESIAQWTIKNAPELLDLPFFQHKLYEEQVAQLIKQAVNDGDVETLETILKRHAKIMPDQFEPSKLEQAKSYIPMWLTDYFVPSPIAHLLSDRTRVQLVQDALETTTSEDCKRVLMPYKLEQDMYISMFGALPPRSAKEIAEDIYKYKLTENPVAMRALHVAQLKEIKQDNDFNAFKEHLSKIKGDLDLGIVQGLASSIAHPVGGIMAENRPYLIELLTQTQKLYADSPNGFPPVWLHMMRTDQPDILSMPGILPKSLPHKQVRELILLHANQGNVKMLEVLMPYARQNGVPIKFSDTELMYDGIPDDKKAGVVEKLNQLKEAKQSQSFISSFWSSSPAAKTNVDGDAVAMERNKQAAARARRGK